jgi:tetratricopeptide (TPR) repeat protein
MSTSESRELLTELEVRALRALRSKSYSKAETAIRLWLNRAIEADEDDHSLARVDTFLADVCYKQRKYEESCRFYEDALLRYRRWYRSNLNTRRFPNLNSRHARASMRASFAHFTGAVLAGWAAAMQALERDDQAAHDLALAQRRLRHALRLEEVDLGRTDSIASMSLLMDLARVYLARRKPTEAEPPLTRILAITESEIARPPERFTASEQAAYRRNPALVQADTASRRTCGKRHLAKRSLAFRGAYTAPCSIQRISESNFGA